MITITMPVAKRCPYAAELDAGELTITLPGDAPELHDLARQVGALGRDGTAGVSHEEFNRQVLDLLALVYGMPGALVVTRWRTGPWDVEVRDGDDLLRQSVEPASA
jgi:hypothetical protein